MARYGDPRVNLWGLLLIIGCSLWFLAFFMPWWGLTQTWPAPPKRPTNVRDRAEFDAYNEAMKEYSNKMQRASRVLSKNRSWYANKVGYGRMQDFEEQRRERQRDAEGGPVSATLRLWGWDTGVGITAFVFSLVLLPVAIVPMFVRLLRNWIWIGYYVAAVAGLVLFILSLVWYFSSPGENVSGLLAQGVGWYPGPYLEILGSLTVLTTGVLGGVFGLLHFLKTLKAPRPAPVKAQLIDEDEGEFED